MASPAQIIANRSNAQHSTGPRTAEGKVHSSRNSLRHGLYSKEFFVLDQEQEEFEQLRQGLLDEVQPVTAIDQALFRQLLHAQWSMRRVRLLEADVLAGSDDPMREESTMEQLEKLSRHYGRAERSFYRALKELRLQQGNRYARKIVAQQQDPELEQAEVVDLPELAGPTEVAYAAAAAERARCMVIPNRFELPVAWREPADDDGA